MYTILTKSLYTQAASYTNHQKKFAADIMHRKKCMKSYLSQFKRDV